jgi:3,4-dihydroxy-2-butanone 4-phosphate synthase
VARRRLFDCSGLATIVLGGRDELLEQNRSDRRTALTDVHERIGAVIETFARGELVIVTDDDRGNEGNLFVAASLCTPDKMAFIIRNTSGIVCAPLTVQEAKRLHLDPMVADAPLQTAFTVSTDFRHGLTTGISAAERTATVRALANGNTGPGDFVRPAHVFPLIAKEGGVLSMRSGHTEACVDLCRLATLPPARNPAPHSHENSADFISPKARADAFRLAEGVMADDNPSCGAVTVLNRYCAPDDRRHGTLLRIFENEAAVFVVNSNDPPERRRCHCAAPWLFRMGRGFHRSPSDEDCSGSIASANGGRHRHRRGVL